MSHVLALFPGDGDLQRVALGVADHEQSSGSQKSRQDDVIEQQLSERGRSTSDILLAVGRVGDDEVELASTLSQLGKHQKHILHAQCHCGDGQSGGGQILAEEARVFLGLLDADHFPSSAAEAFQTQSPAASEQVQDPSPVQKGSEAVEDRQLDLVGRGADSESFRNLQ